MRKLLCWVSVMSMIGAGCVTTGTHEAKVSELQKLRADEARAAAEREKARQEQIRDLEAKRANLQKQLQETSDGLGRKREELAQMGAERDGLRKSLDDTTALVGELKKRLEKLGQNVEKLTSEKGQLSHGLSEAKKGLEDLRRQKAAAEARAATFRGLMVKLRSMIDAGQIKVVIRDGRMLIALPNDVLFDSGKTALKTEGQAAIANVARVLAGISDRKLLVSGHTDDVPIKTARFPSNWELSTARAVEVTRFLVQNGVRPQALAAAGHGEFDPVVPNDSPEHRAQNRRIEIVLQPNISDLPQLDDIKDGGS